MELCNAVFSRHIRRNKMWQTSRTYIRMYGSRGRYIFLLSSRFLSTVATFFSFSFAIYIQRVHESRLYQYSAVIFNSISFHTRTCGTTHKWSFAIHCRVSHVLSCCTRTRSVHNNLHVRMCISWWCILFLLTHLSIDCVCGVVVVVVCSCVSFTIGHLFPHTKSSCSAPSSLGSWMSRLTDGTMLSPQKMTCPSSSMHVQHLNATTDHTGTPQQHFMHILIPSVFPKHVNGAISHAWHCWQSCIVYVVPPMHVWFSF